MDTVILTGLRANGELHLGSLLGSILPMVKVQKNLQQNQQFNMFVADLHSFTTSINHSTLYQNVIQNVKFYIAAGIDPYHNNSYIYRQSFVPAHAELSWILQCFTYFGEASRMTEFKDKSQRMGHKSVTAGMFSYPILMASDVLLYGAKYVPLGDDQKQHMELIRTIAERINNKFKKDLVVVPAPWDQQLKFAKNDISIRIRSLSNPTTKMSKSIDDPKGTINLLDEPLLAHKKVMEATTDSLGQIDFNFETQPGISNLIQIESLLTNSPLDGVINKWKGKKSYGELKSSVAQLIKEFLYDLQAKFNEIDDLEVEKILKDGEKYARHTSDITLHEIQKAVGLRSN
jgi:tryptophanyl-tRNA synthetase